MSKILKVVGASWLQTKISSYVLGILGVLAILALFVGQIERIQEDGTYAATVFYSKKTGYRIEYWGQSNELADIPKGVARAYFRMDMDTIGWSLLEIETNGSYSDEIQAYAAGIVEGALTWSLIHSHLENTIRARCDDQPIEKQCNNFRDALEKSVNMWKSHADDQVGVDPFWHHVSLHYTQINGIYTGWKHGVGRSMKEYETDPSDLYWLNSIAEATEIQRKLNIDLGDEALLTLPDLSSAFVRVVNETAKDGSPTKKLYVAQNAAGRYASMTRILKRYKLNYHLTLNDTRVVPGTYVEFSGYPGSITSQDEFYVVKGENHRLAVTGTALRNYNSKLWKKVNITVEVPLGPRVTAANHLASNVSSWGHVIARSNSGTASKQWLVVDFNKFDHLHTQASRSGGPRHDRSEVVTEVTVDKDVRHIAVYHNNNSTTKGLLALIEQVPGLTHSADLSDAFLEQGYFATYGLPFFKDVIETTQVNKMKEAYGSIFSESESPRAIIFKRGYQNATSLDSIIKLMRQTNLTATGRGDEGKKCDSELDCILGDRGYWSVVGARGDIVSKHKEAFGVIDTKVVSGVLNEPSLEFVAVSGPPYTEIQMNATKAALNKGNLVPIYTELLNDKPEMNGLEIRDLVLQQQEEEEEEQLDLLNKDAIKPFEWSESEFKNATRNGLADKWAFEPFIPKWSW